MQSNVGCIFTAVHTTTPTPSPDPRPTASCRLASSALYADALRLTPSLAQPPRAVSSSFSSSSSSPPASTHNQPLSPLILHATSPVLPRLFFIRTTLPSVQSAPSTLPPPLRPRQSPLHRRLLMQRACWQLAFNKKTQTPTASLCPLNNSTRSCHHHRCTPLHLHTPPARRTPWRGSSFSFTLLQVGGCMAVGLELQSCFCC
jgi:hypothetical protein